MSAESRVDVADAIRTIEGAREDALAVLTMSALAFWESPREDDYRLVGLMGAAGAIGLGLSLGRPDRRVLVVDGDGSLVMQLGVTTAIAMSAPANLTHVLIDNGVYAISGAQPVPGPRDWPDLFRAAGYAEVVTCAGLDELDDAIRRRAAGPRAVVVRCREERPVYPPGAFEIIAAVESARVRATLGDA